MRIWWTRKPQPRRLRQTRMPCPCRRPVKESFSLPAQGTNGSQITWEITAGSEAAVIGEDGYTVAVTRSETEDMQVTFKATVQMAGQSAEREFTVTVEKLLSSDEFLAAAADQLELVNPTM